MTSPTKPPSPISQIDLHFHYCTSAISPNMSKPQFTSFLLLVIAMRLIPSTPFSSTRNTFQPPYALSHLHIITLLSVPPRALHTRFCALNPHHLKATSAITLSLFTIQTSFPPQQQPFPCPCFLHTASPIPRFIKFESSICLYLQTRFPNLSLSLF